MPNKIDKVCKNPNCGKEFKVLYKKRNKKYCSQTCYFEHSRLEKISGKKKDPSFYEKRNCVNCGTEFEERKKRERKLCSDQCRNEWAYKNKEDRVKKSKEAVLEKYGVEYSLQLKETQKKAKEALKEKYGVEQPMHSEELKTRLKKSIQEKTIKSLEEELKNHNLELIDEYSTNKDGGTSIHYHFKCNECGTSFTSTLLGCGKIPICRTCYPLNSDSKLQKEIEGFLNDNEIDFIKNERGVISPMELDIYIPQHNLAIEINGNYWHSEIYKSKNYHLNKTKKCYENGIKLIHIFEDEIYYKKEICLSRLRNQLNLNHKTIYGRQCSVKEIDSKEKREFLNKNHIQGNSIDKVRLALYYNNELVSVMSFSKKRKVMGNDHSNEEWELIRFCNKNNTTVIGSFNKLLNYFIKSYGPYKVITYSDIRWNGMNKNGNVYVKSGFDYISMTRPNYWYLKKHDWFNRQHRFNFRKDVLVKEGYDPNKTEHQIMNERDFYKIWDCGNLKFELINDQ